MRVKEPDQGRQTWSSELGILRWKGIYLSFRPETMNTAEQPMLSYYGLPA